MVAAFVDREQPPPLTGGGARPPRTKLLEEKPVLRARLVTHRSDL